MIRKILVEGMGDKQFMKCYLRFLDLEAQVEIIGSRDREESGGYSPISLIKHLDEMVEGDEVFVVVDANGEGENRRQKIVKGSQSSLNHLLSKKIFLMPDNKSNGELEDLLEKIVSPSGAPFLECFDEYKRCLEINNAPSGPDKKNRLYAYRQAVGAKRKDSEVDYNRPNHWDLNHKALSPLKDFLSKNFTRP